MGWKFATSTTLFISSCVHTTALASYQYRTLLDIGKRQHKIPDQILLLASSRDPAPQPIEDKFKSIQRSSVDVRVFLRMRLSFPRIDGRIYLRVCLEYGTNFALMLVLDGRAIIDIRTGEDSPLVFDRGSRTSTRRLYF
jgi:hypothetical protein